MSRLARAGLIVLSALVLLLLLTPADEVISQEIRHIFVTNWPKIQSIEGEVTVVEPVHQSEMHTFMDILVPPVPPHETTRLIEAGTLEADGFPGVVLSLHGVTKGDVKQPGNVGAILIPDELRIQEGFDERGLMPFALETAATGVTGDSPYFASAQPHHSIAFPRYKILLYNTTDKTVTLDLYAYLTN